MRSAFERVVAIDPEREFLASLKSAMASDGIELEAFTTTAEALEFLGGESRVDAIVCSLELPDASGGRILERLCAIRQGIPVVTTVAFDSVEAGVESLGRGAFSYLIKPFSPAELQSMLDKAAERVAAASASVGPSHELARKCGHFLGMVGDHPSMRTLFQRIRSVAETPSQSTVLLRGESGTGKELVARAIHGHGPTAAAPFLPVNCAAVTPGLLEDQLFGHVRGAFTGADKDRDGVFVAAGEGTLFLDEVSEIGPDLQAKLLRAIQEREVQPLGADLPRPWGARLVVATNRDLEQAVDEGVFRRDLYHRLKVIPIHVPPLRERLEDVPALIGYFLARFHEKSGKRKSLAAEAVDALCRYAYPGNVRELLHLLESAVVTSSGDLITLADLPEEIAAPERAAERRGFLGLADIERAHIVQALRRTGGRKVDAARILHIDRSRLYRLILKYAIEPAEIGS